MILSPPESRMRLLPLLVLLFLPLLGCDGDPTGESTAVASVRAEGLTVLVGDSAGEDPERPGYFDFGTVDHGELVHHSFRVRNDEPRPVVIQKIDVGCGCTVARLSKVTSSGEVVGPRSDLPNHLLTLEPGEVAELALRVDTTIIKVKNMDKLFMVRVISDSDLTPYLTLECHLIVRMAFQVFPEQLELRHMPVGGGAVKPITIKSLSTPAGRLTGVGELPEGVTATLRQSEISTIENPVWVLDAGFLPPVQLGRQAATILVETAAPDGTPTAPIEIQIAGNGVPDVNISPSRFVMRPGLGAESGSVVDGELETFLEGHRFRVTAFTIQGEAADHLEFQADPVLPDARGQSTRWLLKLSTREPGPTGAFTGTVVLELDDPQYATLEIPYVGLDF
ncbi:MAG: DUF1573 domain-containing protein [Planctomycetota bacterium]|nr:DUF1573 domain-containing protein [Planctomycetota bacterium]